MVGEGIFLGDQLQFPHFIYRNRLITFFFSFSRRVDITFLNGKNGVIIRVETTTGGSEGRRRVEQTAWTRYE